LRESRPNQAAMKRPIHADRKTAPDKKRGSVEIGFSITNQRGEQFCCRANAVNLRIKRGVVQMIEGERGCFVWFERGQVEIRDGRRNVLFQLLTGSASSEGGDLTIVAEVAREFGGTVAGERSRGRSPRRPASGGVKKTKTACNPAHAEAA
jgi:hypothetical protein